MASAARGSASVGEPLGEFELIAALRKRIERAGGQAKTSRLVVGSGDDAAVTEVAGAVATTVDAAVEGVHFERGSSPLRSVGAKALAAALSDLAAMGAEPGEAYVQLGIPEAVGEDECLQVADGLADVALAHGVEIAGGDPIFPELRHAKLGKDRVVQPDEVIRRDPEVIVASWCGKAVRKEKIVTRPGWKDVAAVRDGHVHEIKSAYILQPGPAALTDGVRQLQDAFRRSVLA